MHSKELINERLKDECGSFLNGMVVNNTIFADDTVFLDSSVEGLQRLIDNMDENSTNHSMR